MLKLDLIPLWNHLILSITRKSMRFFFFNFAFDLNRIWFCILYIWCYWFFQGINRMCPIINSNNIFFHVWIRFDSVLVFPGIIDWTRKSISRSDVSDHLEKKTRPLISYIQAVFQYSSGISWKIHRYQIYSRYQ